MQTLHLVNKIVRTFSEHMMHALVLDDSNEQYTLTKDSGVPLFGPIPHQLTFSASCWMPSIIWAKHVCTQCGKAANEEGMPGCECGADWKLSAKKYTAEQYLAVASDEIIHRTWNILTRYGKERALRYLLRECGRMMRQQALQVEPLEQRYMESWGVDTRVRVRIGTAPDCCGKGVHPVDALVNTLERDVPQIAAAFGYVPHVTSSSKPGKVLALKGNTQSRMLEETIIALDYLDSSRHSGLASAIRQSVRFTEPSTPALLPVQNAGVAPDTINTWTVFMHIPETEGDMIAMTPATKMPVFTFDQHFHAQPGDTMLIGDGEVFQGNAPLFSSHGAERRYYPNLDMEHTARLSGTVEGGIAQTLVTATVTTHCQVDTAFKLVDLAGNKGLVNRITATTFDHYGEHSTPEDEPLSSFAVIDFAGEQIDAGAFLSPGRMCDEVQDLTDGTVRKQRKMKTGSAILYAALSQLMQLRQRRGVEVKGLVGNISAEKVFMALEQELRAHWSHIDGVRTKLDTIDVYRAETTELDEEMQNLLLALAEWPVYINNQYVRDYVVSYHAFMVMPQIPWIITTTSPSLEKDSRPYVELDDEDESLFTLDMEVLNTKPDNSRTGAKLLGPYELDYIRHNAPELYDYFGSEVWDVAEHELTQTILSTLLQQPIMMTTIAQHDTNTQIDRLLSDPALCACE